MATSLELTLLKYGLQDTVAQVLGRNEYNLQKSAIPAILVPNGTVATNGTITLGTALPVIYTSAWVRLPAGAVVGGLAGLYYVVFSSTTVGQVYTAFVDPALEFVPTIPTTLVAAVGSNAAYTQATATDINLATVRIVGQTLGENGTLAFNALTSNNNSGGIKTASVKFGATTVATVDLTTTLTNETAKRVTNRGVGNKQLVHNVSTGGTSTTAITQSSIDTFSDVLLTFTGKIATATDYLVLENYEVRLLLV